MCDKVALMRSWALRSKEEFFVGDTQSTVVYIEFTGSNDEMLAIRSCIGGGEFFESTHPRRAGSRVGKASLYAQSEIAVDLAKIALEALKGDKTAKANYKRGDFASLIHRGTHGPHPIT